jgi:hypothetical protein
MRLRSRSTTADVTNLAGRVRRVSEDRRIEKIPLESEIQRESEEAGSVSSDGTL